MNSLELLQKFNARQELSRRNLLDFTQYLWPQFHATQFHANYYRVLDMFAKGQIKNLIVTIPPQHGKSQGSSKYLPAFMLGLNPDLNIALMSYSTTFARKFNRHLQRTIDTDKYRGIFPGTTINSDNVVTMSRGFLRNADEFEIIDRLGSFKTIGREGALTGNPVDVLIFDDLYKDAMEGNSPIVRENVIEMYKSVAETRLHNGSQQICVFTRWHEDDLIGWFENHHNVFTLKSFEDVELIEDWQNTWAKINFEAIKESEPTELDPREIGEPLYPERHSLKKLQGARQTDSQVFECMYQGNPQPKEGLLYGQFKEYEKLPEVIIKRANYTDTADTGSDYLASVCYVKGKDGLIYVTDILYTQEPMEVTEKELPLMLERNDIRDAMIESNNGGRGFARVIDEKTPRTVVRWFHQSGNKESRILTNSSAVTEKILMPYGWKKKWPEVHRSFSAFKKLFKANKHDDIQECFTGIIEQEYPAFEYTPHRPQSKSLSAY
jgi:predicted phage terminase large subunit-like protein